MKESKRFFWIGLLIAGVWVYSWLRRRLREAEREQTAPAATPPAAAPIQKAAQPLPPATPAAALDDLEEINGIGATYARRLRAAGIRTFADLAALTPEEALEAAKAQPWQADPADWIAQAKDRD